MNRREFLKTTFLTAAMAAGSQSLPHFNSYKANAATGETAKMKCLVLTGSPRKNGNSNVLAESFIKGITENGHNVFRFDTAQHNISPCIACNSCGMDGPCVQKDDFALVRDRIIEADCIVFASPMYYFGISAQLKAVIDRFYAINGQIHKPKKAVLLLAYANRSPQYEQPIAVYYEQLLKYLGWTDAGRVIASGVWTAGSVLNTQFPQQAYELGRNML